MIEDLHNNLQYEIHVFFFNKYLQKNEKKEREQTTDALLKLLEDACV